MNRSKPVGGSMFSQRARLNADLPPATAAAAVRAAAREADHKVGWYWKRTQSLSLRHSGELFCTAKFERPPAGQAKHFRPNQVILSVLESV